jgi:hypothetical protein
VLNPYVARAKAFDKLVGSISTAIAPDMEKLASGFSKLSDVSKTFDLAKFKDMATGMAAIADPLAEFGKSGIVANFVGDEALSDIASGITALNNTQVAIDCGTSIDNVIAKSNNWSRLTCRKT